MAPLNLGISSIRVTKLMVAGSPVGHHYRIADEIYDGWKVWKTVAKQSRQLVVDGRIH